jgi:hypothetical protein
MVPILSMKSWAVLIAEALAFFAVAFALHADDDTAVGEGFGQVTDGGDEFGAPGAVRRKAG